MLNYHSKLILDEGALVDLAINYGKVIRKNDMQVIIVIFFNIWVTFILLLLFVMNHYALCLSHHSNTKLFCLNIFCQAKPTRRG